MIGVDFFLCRLRDHCQGRNGSVFLTSSNPRPPNNPEFAINSVSTVASIMTVSAMIGILLFGVVLIARWFGGEYKK